MKPFALLFAVAVSLCALSPLARTQEDPKAAADQVVHWIVERQNADGSYGAGLADTCRVLDLLGRCPRRYTELDGPFFRRAAQRVAEAAARTDGTSSPDVKPDATPSTTPVATPDARPDAIPDALVVLGLAATLSPAFQEPRDAALARLRTHSPAGDYDRWLALRSFPDDTAPLPTGSAAEAAAPAIDPARDAGLACLVAADPATVAAPPVTDVAAWTRWARAARLRQVQPSVLPPLPSINETASLPALMATLETLIQMHGLFQPPVFRVDDDDTGANTAATPALVPPGRTLETAQREALAFFDRHQRHGGFSLEIQGWDSPEPGVTALCLSATVALADALHQPRPAWLDEGLDFLVSLQKPDGAIEEGGLAVYTTSVAIEALLAAGRDRDKPVIERARTFLVAGQFDESDGFDAAEDAFYGGVGYGDGQRPDLSNSQMAIEAVARAGLSADDPFFTKAVVFLQLCQNFAESQPQSRPRVGGGTLVAGNDGGGTYLPGKGAAGEIRLAEGVYQARSYGSMTYALAKSYILCGVPADDAHLAAAIGWLADHFSVDRNPGFENDEDGAQGLYYYYLSLGRTLRRLQPDAFVDRSGKPIAWRPALTRKLLDNQRIDGSWINTGSVRWYEGAPTLCTAFAVLALTDANS